MIIKCYTVEQIKIITISKKWKRWSYETLKRYRKLIEDNGAICVDTTTTMIGRIEYFKGNFILDFEHSIYAKIILEENIEDLW